ncbi:MAG: hypothetical protein GC131_08960 [Alphaproteobacteria bacterium]|nr:hypothetical protein [Alphaproteobacteria bacterium]
MPDVTSATSAQIRTPPPAREVERREPVRNNDRDQRREALQAEAQREVQNERAVEKEIRAEDNNRRGARVDVLV